MPDMTAMVLRGVKKPNFTIFFFRKTYKKYTFVPLKKMLKR